MPCKLCVVITATDSTSAQRELEEASKVADLAELRLDYIKDPDLTMLLSNKPLPVVATARPLRQGGRFSGSEESRLALLQRSARLGADYVDVEFDSIEKFAPPAWSGEVIGSYHNFQEVPPDLEAIVLSLEASRADIVKVACMVSDVTENLRLLRVLKFRAKPAIAIGMGEAGFLSRVLAGKFGAFLTYASLGKGKESAPAQVSARELVDVFRFREIGEKSQLFGVMGNPVAHSRSPHLFNALFKRIGLDAVYLPLLVSDAPATLRAFRELDFRGYSVTVPHKEAALEAMDEVDPQARKIGALNTVACRKGRLFGYNTDVVGALEALSDALGGGPEVLEGKRVILLGAGGAARAIAFALFEAGAKLTLLNRTEPRGRKLAEEVGCGFRSLSELPKIDYDILINATQVGMTPREEENLVPKEALRKGAVVFDVVYTPLETRLIREAREAGAKVVTGLEMFLRQAAEQYEIWFGKTLPLELFRSCLMEEQ